MSEEKPPILTDHTEIGKTSMEELFNRDPLEQTDEDLDRIVAALRAQRHNFLQAEHNSATGQPKVKAGKVATPKAPAEAKPAKVAKPKAGLGQLNLADLGITIEALPAPPKQEKLL